MFSSYARAAFSAVAVVAAISACSSTDTKSADAPASTTESSLTDTATSAISPAPTETTELNEPEESQDQQVPPGTATAPCDNVSEELLEQAVIGSEVEQRLRRPVDFEEYQCAGDYARARTNSDDREVQSTGVLFRYDQGRGWTAFDIGSAIACTEQHGIPPEIVAQLHGCY